MTGIIVHTGVAMTVMKMIMATMKTTGMKTMTEGTPAGETRAARVIGAHRARVAADALRNMLTATHAEGSLPIVLLLLQEAVRSQDHNREEAAHRAAAAPMNQVGAHQDAHRQAEAHLPQTDEVIRRRAAEVIHPAQQKAKAAALHPKKDQLQEAAPQDDLPHRAKKALHVNQ